MYLCFKLLDLHNSLVFKELNEMTSDYGSVSEALLDLLRAAEVSLMLTGYSIIPVCHRNSGFHFVICIPKMSDHFFERFAIR